MLTKGTQFVAKTQTNDLHSLGGEIVRAQYAHDTTPVRKRYKLIHPPAIFAPTFRVKIWGILVKIRATAEKKTSFFVRWMPLNFNLL
jgi:hypothetical protein